MHAKFQDFPFYRPLIQLLLSLLSAAVILAADQPVILTLKDADDRILFQRQASQPAIFAIRYTHSVALSPVIDYFVIRNNRIFLDKTVYKDFGAGLPPAPEGSQVMNFGNGHIEISGYNRELSCFDLRVGRVAGHTLLLWENASPDKPFNVAIPLNRIAPPGSAITFTVEVLTTR